jgi:hypothetical protein
LAIVAAVLTRKHAVRGLIAWCVASLIASLIPTASIAAQSAFDVSVLNPGVGDPTVGAVTSGSLDDKFEPFASVKPQRRSAAYWLKLKTAAASASTGIPVVVMHAARQTRAALYAVHDGAPMLLPQATQLPGFRGTQDTVFILAEGQSAGQTLYAHVDVSGSESDQVSFTDSTLDRTLERGEEHERMIALTFGALIAVSLAALLIWFVLKDRLFILYATFGTYRSA